MPELRKRPRVKTLPEDLRSFLQTREEWSIEIRDSMGGPGCYVVGALSININDVMYNIVNDWLSDVLSCEKHLEVDMGNVVGLRPTAFRSSMILDMYDFTLSARKVTNTSVPSWFNYKEYIWEEKLILKGCHQNLRS